MKPKSTLSIQKMHNEIIEANIDSTDGEGYFWSLCRPQYGMKKRQCIDCGREMLSNNSGHRKCAKCGSVKGAKRALTKSMRGMRA
jgi:exosome complex RNA-binding protein Csl4